MFLLFRNKFFGEFSREYFVPFRSISSVTMSGLESLADVDIDSKGKFKYILIEVKDTKSNERKHIVRGYARCGYHADILGEMESKAPKGLSLNCVGGGRILHEPENKKLKVYGYSQGFGQADHKISVQILQKKYPDYNITMSNEGY
ncbi:hypothetical protein M3Y96_00885500 [Aphelenchoides besseyi]|nr:hypothetical protein M3Y96_00885500 [Aphelenchoides besseyi]